MRDVTQIRVAADRLSEDFDRALNAVNEGTDVLVERNGEVVARLVAQPPTVDWLEFRRRLLELEPLDEEFEEAVMAALRERNREPENADWAF